MRQSSLLLVLLAACATPPPPNKRVPAWVEKLAAQTTPEQMKEYLEKLHGYVSTLDMFNSSDPKAWASAQQRLAERFSDFYLDVEVDPKTNRLIPKDPILIQQTKSDDPAVAAQARKTLGRGARIFIDCWVFRQGTDLEAWDRAFRELKSLGEDAQETLAVLLMHMLYQPVNRAKWPHLRSYLIELGPIGEEAVRHYLDNVLLPEIPETPIFSSKEDLEQSLVVVMGYGPSTRTYIQALAKHSKWFVRKSLALAIGEAKELGYLEVLEDYVRTDPQWEVRMGAYTALGKINWAVDRTEAVLIRALAVERDDSCVKQIAQSLADLKSTAALPHLIEALENPSYPVVEALMESLERITHAGKKSGHPLRTPHEWKEWYKKNQ